MRYLIVLLAIAGIVVATMALRVHQSTDAQPCSINEHWDCGIVNHSRYAEIHGLPVATIGIAGYGLLGLLAIFRLRKTLAAAAVVGLAFTLWLTNLEWHVLQIWCLYCVISQGIIALITLLAVFWMEAGLRKKKAAA